MDKLEGELLAKLRAYLLDREFDIAINMEDFGLLKEIFEAVVGRKASVEEVK